MDERRFDGLTKAIARGTTRRTVVKAGTRLAYAAPLVAASMRLGAAPVAAISSGGGTNPDPGCEGHDACTGNQSCGANCSCGTLVGGGGICRTHTYDCGNPACGSHGDCPAGYYCVDTSSGCCPDRPVGVCTLRCGA